MSEEIEGILKETRGYLLTLQALKIVNVDDPLNNISKAIALLKAQQEAKIVEGMKMDEKQANKGVCKDCYYAGSFTCEH